MPSIWLFIVIANAVTSSIRILWISVELVFDKGSVRPIITPKTAAMINPAAGRHNEPKGHK